MIELNEEIAEGFVKGLILLNNFGKVDKDAKINLFHLPLVMCSYNIDKWLLGVVELLFTSGIEVIYSDYVTDVKEIQDAVKKHSVTAEAQMYDDFLVTYGYDKDVDEITLESAQFKDNLEEFYFGYGIRRIEFFTPLIQGKDSIHYDFLDHVPGLVENYFGLQSHSLTDIDIVYNKTYNKYTIVMYIYYDRGCSVVEEIYVHELIEYFEELLKSFHVDSNRKI